MRLKKAVLRNFRRFSDLTVTDIPVTARLVILAGPNGVGKSSFFDGLQTWYRVNALSQSHGDEVYSSKKGSLDPSVFYQRVTVELHEGLLSPEQLRKQGGVYFRTAYRHEVDLQAGSLSRQTSLAEGNSPARRSVDVDQSVSENYQRLLWQTFSAIYDPDIPDDTTKAQISERLTGQLRAALLRIFPDLTLTRVGGLGQGAAFEFRKGTSVDFPYVNLSAGEKAVLDLLLDAVVKAEFYQGAIWCIDEPEVHIGTRAQGLLLRELVNLLPAGSQLFMASHSLGLMSEAVKLAESSTTGEVIFLDLADHDFDSPVIIRPVDPTREFWQRTLRVALDDLAALVAPRTVVMCEGIGDGFDARCYRQIFSGRYPDTDFVSAGNGVESQSDRIGLTSALQTITPGTRLLRLRDRDLASPEEVEQWRAQANVRVLRRRHLESYLFDLEVLHALCEESERPELKPVVDTIVAEEMMALADRRKDADDVKAASGQIYIRLRAALQLTGAGTTARAFAEFRLAPLLKPGLRVYDELAADIFGVSPGAGS